MTLDVAGIGCPDGKVYTGDAVDGHQMRAQLFIDFMVIAHAEPVEVFRCQLRQEKVGIVYVALMTVVRAHMDW